MAAQCLMTLFCIYLSPQHCMGHERPTQCEQLCVMTSQHCCACCLETRSKYYQKGWKCDIGKNSYWEINDLGKDYWDLYLSLEAIISKRAAKLRCCLQCFQLENCGECHYLSKRLYLRVYPTECMNQEDVL